MKKFHIILIIISLLFLLSNCADRNKIKMKYVYDVTIIGKSIGLSYNFFEIIYRDSINASQLYKSELRLEKEISNHLNINNKLDSLLVENDDVK